MKKYHILTALFCAGILICTGCGNQNDKDAEKTKAQLTTQDSGQTAAPESGEDENTTKPAAEDPKAYSLAEIYQAVTKQVKFPEMSLIDDADYLFNYFGIESENMEDGIFYTAEDFLLADAIVILKGKDEEAAASLKENLNSYIENKKNELADYLPEQYDIVARGNVEVKGTYVYMILSENAADAEKIVNSMLP